MALYNPIQNEVETGDIRDHALVTGKNVFFPRFGLKDSLELIRSGRRPNLARAVLESWNQQAKGNSRAGIARNWWSLCPGLLSIYAAIG